MNNMTAYGIVLVTLFFVYLRTTRIQSSDKEYFVLNKTEGVFGLSLSFYASGMGLWILTSPAEVAWYGLGYDIYGYALSAATPFILIYFFGPKIASLTPEGATLPQFIEKRYGSSAQKVVSIVAVTFWQMVSEEWKADSSSLFECGSNSLQTSVSVGGV